MDFKEFLRYSSSSVALLIASAAAAQALTVTQTINLNAGLTQGGGTATGQFDITGLLAPPSSFIQPYDVVSATISAYGYSAPATTQVTGAYSTYSLTNSYTYTNYYSYSCGWFSTCYGSYDVTNRTYQRSQTNTNLDNVADTMQLTAGGDQFSGAVTSHDTSIVSASTQSDGSSANNLNGTDYYYTYYSVVNDILSGALSAGGTLSATALADLAQDGLLPFSVDASIGQFTLQSVTLDVTLNANGAQSDIPEPEPVAPMSAGLLLLMLYRRLTRKRRRSAEA